MEVNCFNNLQEMMKNLSYLVKRGDTVLVKASHFMHFEKVVEALTNL